MAERKDRRRPLFPLTLVDFAGGSQKGICILRPGFLGDDILEVIGSNWQFTVDKNVRISAKDELLTLTDNLAGLSVGYSRAYGNLESFSFLVSSLLKKADARGVVGREDGEVIERLGSEKMDLLIAISLVGEVPWLTLAGLSDTTTFGHKQEAIASSVVGAIPGQPTFSWWSNFEQLLLGRVGVEINATTVVPFFEGVDRRKSRYELCRIQREVNQISRFDLTRTTMTRIPTKVELGDLTDAIFGLE